jgi:hypothetical protein
VQHRGSLLPRHALAEVFSGTNTQSSPVSSSDPQDSSGCSVYLLQLSSHTCDHQWQTRGLGLAHKLPVERWIDNSALGPRRMVRWIHLDLVSTRCRDRLPRPTIISLGISQWTTPAVHLPPMHFCLLYFKRSHSLYVAVNAIQDEFLCFLYIVGLHPHSALASQN